MLNLYQQKNVNYSLYLLLTFNKIRGYMPKHVNVNFAADLSIIMKKVLTQHRSELRKKLMLT
ncbi:MAG TPA: hypothetical protein DCL86_02845 [Bacteroidales bacterium]|jgi:hypothetical protein|nr:hypothetical protein [Bacteroidales bacterium]